MLVSAIIRRGKRRKEINMKPKPIIRMLQRPGNERALKILAKKWGGTFSYLKGIEIYDDTKIQPLPANEVRTCPKLKTPPGHPQP